MFTLYDSDRFAVVHLLHGIPDNDLPDADAEETLQHGFEIVDKLTGKGIYLDGVWADLFQKRIARWQQTTPTQEEVEDTLEGYSALAQNPMVLH